MVHQRLRDVASATSFLADHVYTPEMILTSWFSLSFGSMTVAMVFYGIAMHKTLAHHLFIEAITIGLIALSIYYTYTGFVQYDKKLQYAMVACMSDDVCSTGRMDQIKSSQTSVTLSSTATIVIDVLIASLVMFQSYKQIAK